MLLFLHHITGLFQWILEAYWHCIGKYSVLSEYFFLDASNFHTTHFQHHNTQLYFMGYQQTFGILASSPTCQLNCSQFAGCRHMCWYQCHVIFNTLQLIINSTRKIKLHTYIKTSLFHLFSFHYITVKFSTYQTKYFIADT